MLSSEKGKWKQLHQITLCACFSSVSPNVKPAYIMSAPFEPLIQTAFAFVQVMLIFSGHSPSRVFAKASRAIGKEVTSSPVFGAWLSTLVMYSKRVFTERPSTEKCPGVKKLDKERNLK